MRLNEDVLRYLTLRVDELDEELSIQAQNKSNRSYDNGTDGEFRARQSDTSGLTDEKKEASMISHRLMRQQHRKKRIWSKKSLLVMEEKKMNSDSRSSGDKSDGPRGGADGVPFPPAENVRSLGTMHQRLIIRTLNYYPDISPSGVKSSRVGSLPCPPRSNANWRERSKGPVFWLSCLTFHNSVNGPVPGAQTVKRCENA